jgi:hypothetical protein
MKFLRIITKKSFIFKGGESLFFSEFVFFEGGFDAVLVLCFIFLCFLNKIVDFLF